MRKQAFFLVVLMCTSCSAVYAYEKTMPMAMTHDIEAIHLACITNDKGGGKFD